jgi:replicative DNA helicase
MTHYAKPKRENPQDTINALIGMLPPNAEQLEQAVIGALLVDREAYGVVEDILTPESFYQTANGLIYKAIQQLHKLSAPVDILTVTEQLTKSGDIEAVGGAYYVVELSNRVASAANLEFHALILKEKAIRRNMIQVCQNNLRRAYDESEDTFEVLGGFEKSVFEISNGIQTQKETTISNAAFEVVKLADLAMAKKGLTGVPSGLTTVDAQTGGWQPSDLIILAARPGMGKTSFAMQVALNAAMMGLPCAFFSLEMSSVQLTQRVVSQLANIPVQNIRTGKMTERDLQDIGQAVETLQGIPLYLDDTPGISITSLRSKARKLVASKGVKVIFVDYVQLMTTTVEKGASRDQYLGDITRGLKGLAKELNIPVIALSQLSRALENRSDKRPQLSDLRETGNLEQDADAVVFLYRPEYYGITQDEQGANVTGQCEAIFAKHRNGAVGACGENVGFNDKQTKFYNLSEVQYAPTQFPTTDFTQHRPNYADIPF